MSNPRKPAVFRLEPQTESKAKSARGPQPVVADAPDVFAEPQLPAVSRDADPLLDGKTPVRRRLSLLARIFWGALTALLSIAIGHWFWKLVDDLAKTNPVLGQIGLGLLVLACVALLALVAREVAGIMRLQRATDLREQAEAAFVADHQDQARRVVRRLIAFQEKDPTTAAARAQMERDLGEIIDGQGMLKIAERTLLHPQDARAREAIATAARRVSVVTAISPRALVDVLFVAAQSIMLIRKIADIYGARPGSFGFMSLSRRILAHLAITGGVAITDGVVSQLVGHGMAARLSAKLGEGVLNGLLTARIGLACIAACRPMPFMAGQEPRLQDVAGEILSNPLGKDNASA
jgi:putative membrane protein